MFCRMHPETVSQDATYATGTGWFEMTVVAKTAWVSSFLSPVTKSRRTRFLAGTNAPVFSRCTRAKYFWAWLRMSRWPHMMLPSPTSVPAAAFFIDTWSVTFFPAGQMVAVREERRDRVTHQHPHQASSIRRKQRWRRRKNAGGGPGGEAANE